VARDAAEERLRTMNDAFLDAVGLVFRLLADFFFAMPESIAETATDSIQLSSGRAPGIGRHLTAAGASI